MIYSSQHVNNFLISINNELSFNYIISVFNTVSRISFTTPYQPYS